MKINHAIAFFIPGLMLIGACKEKEKKQENAVKGTLTHAANSTIYLERFDEKGEHIVDSCRAGNDGSFTLMNPATEKDYYGVRTDHNNIIYLMLDGKESISITGDAKNLDSTYTVKGSEDSQLIKELKSYDKNLSDSLFAVYAQYRDNAPEKKDSVGAAMQKYFAHRMEWFAEDFITRYPKSLVALSAVHYLDQQNSTPLLENLLASLVKEYPNSKFVKDFEGVVNDMKKLPVGSLAPEIKLNTPEGKTLALSSLRGKTVLIDFWASWCGPCRKENPHVVEMYRKFKNKNFEIFGVSLDENINAWKDAIRKDGIKWIQVSELKKWDSQVVSLYQVDAIPYTVLIDRNGKIIAKGLLGDQLEQKLIEIL